MLLEIWVSNVKNMIFMKMEGEAIVDGKLRDKQARKPWFYASSKLRPTHSLTYSQG